MYRPAHVSQSLEKTFNPKKATRVSFADDSRIVAFVKSKPRKVTPEVVRSPTLMSAPLSAIPPPDTNALRFTTSIAALPLEQHQSSLQSIEAGDSDNPSDHSEDEINTMMIPKPTGEVGRPGRGGYNLQEALDWDVDLLRKLKVRSTQSTMSIRLCHDSRNMFINWLINILIHENLSRNKVLSVFILFGRWYALSSPCVILNAKERQAMNQFPIVENYVHAWPVLDLIRMRLKYTSSRHKQQNK